MFLPIHGIPIHFHQSYTSNVNPNFKVCIFQKDRAVYSVHALIDVLAAVEISSIVHLFFHRFEPSLPFILVPVSNMFRFQ